MIPEVLKIIRDNQGNYSKIEEKVTNLWRQESNRKKPPTSRNSMRAVFGPTLRHLHLVRGEGDYMKLLSCAKEFLKAYEIGAVSDYKKSLAKHLLKLDKEKWLNILGHLRASNDKLNRTQLLDIFCSKYPESGINEDRLSKFLLYCGYAGLVTIKNNFVTLRKTQYDISTKSIDKRLTDNEFLYLLHKQYELLRSESKGSPYVPIPDLRDSVCESSGIWLTYFDDKLRDIPKETDNYMIQLSQPMVRKPDGISIGGKYLYYIAIYKKERSNE